MKEEKAKIYRESFIQLDRHAAYALVVVHDNCTHIY